MQSLQNSFNNYQSENKQQAQIQPQPQIQNLIIHEHQLANENMFIQQEQRQFKGVSDLFTVPASQQPNDQMLNKLLG